jgi:signal transduction histidine kinase
MQLGMAMRAADLGDLAGLTGQLAGEHGLRPAVDGLVARSPVAVTVHGDLDHRPAPSVEVALYFTIAEALTNVAEYAGAREVTVTLASDDGQAQVEVRDDGNGGAEPANGSGLRGLVDRLGALGGQLHVHSEPGPGRPCTPSCPSTLAGRPAR